MPHCQPRGTAHFLGAAFLLSAQICVVLRGFAQVFLLLLRNLVHFHSMASYETQKRVWFTQEGRRTWDALVDDLEEGGGSVITRLDVGSFDLQVAVAQSATLHRRVGQGVALVVPGGLWKTTRGLQACMV